MTTFHYHHNEKYRSQIPALQELIALGYEYLSPEQALAMRGSKNSNVLLENILREQLKKFNRIHHQGKDYHFSEANIQEAIQKIKNVPYDGLKKTNKVIYDLLTLAPPTLEQTVEGNRKSFNLHYIDWKTPANNMFHVVPEFSVARRHSNEMLRPDIVLFVNGIPLAVIECKAPDIDLEQGISQMIRNQGDDYIPTLFTYVQLVLVVSSHGAKYATVDTSAQFWSVWKEWEDDFDPSTGSGFSHLINTPLSDDQKEALFSGEFASARGFFQRQEQAGERLPTEQDKALHSLCRPERLLELTYRFTLFDAGIKKIARYQQFFVVRQTLARIRHVEHGRRRGGIIWHTQGSGKSLTMVMLARALALDAEIINPRIILVTDRDDLDQQLGDTFKACGLDKKRATSGRHLVQHLKEKVGIITTLIHKFDKGWVAEKYVDESPDIFVLVDESHRTQFGELATRMRKMLPNACYLGFTGTPLLKKEKHNFLKFGGLIKPHYAIRQAVDDKAVLPLLYEGRQVQMMLDSQAIDRWFARHTAGLAPAQQADLKKKYARADRLHQADRVIYMQAFDISEHYRANWQGTGFKAQLVAPSKTAALTYYKYFKEIGVVTSEVIMSPPDTREGHQEVNAGPTDEVGKFWQKMMQRFGSEKAYTQGLINQFKGEDEPEILIVVDKLLTGFDAPRNTVFYLCRPLREHTLLQAIARVNRLYEGKEHGHIVDYVGTLGELDKALTSYDALAGFDQADLGGTLTALNDEVKKLPQHHGELWDVFREVRHTQDMEAYEVLLADDSRREMFYAKLAQYGRTLGLALSSERFIMDTDEAQLHRYKRDLKFFQKLKQSVQLRYAEVVDARDCEPKIKKLLDTHIGADDVIQLNAPVNIFDDGHFAAVKQGQGVHSGQSDAAKADTIAHAIKKVIHENMDDDPALYKRFSDLIQQVIDDFREKRISDLDYLNKVSDMRDSVVSKKHDDVPEIIQGNAEACAYYGMANDSFRKEGLQVEEETVAYMATHFQQSLQKEQVVDFWNNQDAINKVKAKMDDYFYDELKHKQGIELQPEQMDHIIENTLRIAKSRRRGR